MKDKEACELYPQELKGMKKNYLIQLVKEYM
jgi:hypothetical protein